MKDDAEVTELLTLIKKKHCVVIGSGPEAEVAKKALDHLMADYEVVEPTTELTKGIKTLTGEAAKLNVFVGG